MALCGMPRSFPYALKRCAKARRFALFSIDETFRVKRLLPVT
jgi:hypothetical protein